MLTDVWKHGGFNRLEFYAALQLILLADLVCQRDKAADVSSIGAG